MNPIIDLSLEGVFKTVLPPQTMSTNNAASVGVDLLGFKGKPCLNVQIAGGSGTTPGITLIIQTSATNNASNATNWNGTNLSPITNPTSNNSANVAVQIPIDVRGALRYLFLRAVITGSSTPAFVVFAEIIGSDGAQ